MGDELNIHVGQTLLARAEIEELVSVRKNTMLSKGPFPLLNLSQDTIIGAYLITYTNKPVLPDEWNDIATYAFTERWSEKFWRCNEYEDWPLTTYTLISLCFPPTFNYTNKNVVIKNGQLISGRINKDHISNKPFGIPRMILARYDEDTYIDFMNSIVRLVNLWLAKNSFSVGLDDCVLRGNVKETIKNEVSDSILNLTRDISTIDKDSQVILDRSYEADSKVYFILNNSKELGNKIVDKNMSEDNNIKLAVDSGAKGNYVNIFQITAMLGQQILEGKRIWPSYYKTRSLPCYFDPEIANIFGPKPEYKTNYIEIEPMTKLERMNLKSKLRHKSIHYSNIKTKHSKTQLRYPWSWNTMDIIERDKFPIEWDILEPIMVPKQDPITPITDFKHFLKLYYESGGFISSSLLEGLNPREYYFHSSSGRDGLISTSCSTSVTGYTERRLTKMMEDIQVSYNRTIVNSVTNKVIQFSESTDCFNTSMLIGNKIVVKDKLFEGL